MSSTQIQGNNFTYITSGATTQVFKGTGVLVAIVINKPLAGTVKLIDNMGGSTANIATLASGTAQAITTQGRIEYNVSCASGLIVINSATEDITVIWRQG
jgi:hypothetical protein